VAFTPDDDIIVMHRTAGLIRVDPATGGQSIQSQGRHFRDPDLRSAGCSTRPAESSRVSAGNSNTAAATFSAVSGGKGAQTATTLGVTTTQSSDPMLTVRTGRTDRVASPVEMAGAVATFPSPEARRALDTNGTRRDRQDRGVGAGSQRVVKPVASLRA
jgi:hypothetical protein